MKNDVKINLCNYIWNDMIGAMMFLEPKRKKNGYFENCSIADTRNNNNATIYCREREGELIYFNLKEFLVSAFLKPIS